MACAIAIALLLNTPAVADTPLAVPVEGKPFDAKLTAADDQWQLTFGSGDTKRVLPAAELVRWGNCSDITRGPLLVLADGGLLAADPLSADRRKLTAESLLLGAVELPLELLAAAAFRLPADRHRRDLLLDRLSADGNSDRVLLANGDELTGSLTGLDADKVRLETNVGRLDIEMSRIAAIAFNPALARRPRYDKLTAWAGLSDGSRLRATRLIVDGKAARISVAGGRQWIAPSGELVFLQPIGGSAVYLSDLDSAAYRFVPYLNLDWPWRADRNVTGGMIRAAGRLHLKGLGVHSAARLSYKLDKPYRRFQAEAAIDDSTAGGGSVHFSVYVDRQQKFASPVVRGGDRPIRVSVDVTGGSRVDLIVDYADRADVLDHANWLDARFVH